MVKKFKYMWVYHGKPIYTSFNNYQHLANLVSFIPLDYFEMKPRHYIISLRVYLFFDVRYYIYFKNYVFAWYIYISCMAANLWSDLFSAFCN